MLRVYRYKNLVYCGHNVSASSLYESYCEEKNWIKIKYQDIDFTKDIVFGFILDPLKRHKSGFYFDLKNYTAEEKQFILSTENIFKYFAIFSHHNLPLLNIHKENLEKIHWIPLDLNTQGVDGDIIHTADHKNMFCKLLNHIDVEPDLDLLESIDLESKKRNLHRPDFNTTIEQIENLMTTSSGTGCCAMYIGLEKDFNLYDAVIKYTHHWNDSWDRVTWLNNRSTSGDFDG